MNRFEFLKNYKEFAAYIRYRTNSVLLGQLRISTDHFEKRSLMLRIIEDLASSTEDLSMWLVAVMGRNDGNHRFRDEWERLLKMEINQNESKGMTKPSEVLSKFVRLRTTKGFLERLDLPSLEHISKELSSDQKIVDDAVNKVKSSIDMALKQRKERSGLLLLVQNKLKHGMMVYADSDPNKSLIRIFTVKMSKNEKRIVRRNRIVEIPIDIGKAGRMTNTIKAYGQAIEALINLLLIDYKNKIITGKIRTRKPNKDKCLAEIDKALH